MSLNTTLYQSKEISRISDILISPRVNHSTTPDKNLPSPLSRLLISAALVPGVWVRVWGWLYHYGPIGPNGRISDLEAARYIIIAKSKFQLYATGLEGQNMYRCQVFACWTEAPRGVSTQHTANTRKTWTFLRWSSTSPFHTSCRGKWALTWSPSWWARSWTGNANFFQQSVCNAKAFTENLRMRSIIRNANANGSPVKVFPEPVI